MEAFNYMGNHLVSDSASTINAGDDMSTVDGDESILNMATGPRRRRHDDEEEISDSFEDDDLESMASVPVDRASKATTSKPEEDKELPIHSCA